MGASFNLEKAVRRDGQPDGSAGVAISPDRFIAACDEDNILRLYTTDSSSSPRELLDLNSLLGFPPSKKGKFKECDIEGAARIGDLVFWIGSHGRNKKGEAVENRRVFFATRLQGSGESISLVPHGAPCKTLLEAMIADPRLAGFDLASASEKRPEEEGGLNIESLCADGDKLLIGFRNPITAAGALLVPLKNPRAVVEGTAPEFDAPVVLPLGGLGIRDMAKWNSQFLIIGGPFGDKAAPGTLPSRLFLWSGGNADLPVALSGDLGDLNPEAVLVYGEGRDAIVHLLSDDGGDSFRSARVTIDAGR